MAIKVIFKCYYRYTIQYKQLFIQLPYNNLECVGKSNGRLCCQGSSLSHSVSMTLSLIKFVTISNNHNFTAEVTVTVSHIKVVMNIYLAVTSHRKLH